MPWLSPRLSQPHSPRFSHLPSAPVLCLQQLRGAKQLVPRLGGPALRFPVRLAGLPLPYPLPALARSPPAPRIHAAAGRGGREGGRAADGSDGADLVLARNSGKTQPAGVLPPLSNSSSALRSCAPSPAFGPFLSADVGCGSFAPRWPARHLQLRFPPPAPHSAPLRLPLLPPAPYSAAPYVAVAVAGSGGERRGGAVLAGTVSLHPSRVGLRAQGLAEKKVNHYFATRTASLALSHPGLGRKGRGSWPDGDLGFA